MTDRDALLATILANPDDDAPRLVFADWLEENGEPDRGEFIRVQCGNVERPGRDEYRSLCRAALKGHVYFNGGTSCNYKNLTATKWHGHIPGGWQEERAVGPDGQYVAQVPNVVYRRGFAEVVRMPAADWMAHGDALLAAHPVTAVTLTTWPGHDWQMANLPPDWPLSGMPTGERYIALDALEHRWPTVRTWTLPPEPGAERIRRVLDGDPSAPRPLGVIDFEEDELAADPAPPPEARRRGGHSRMPDWLRESRARPRR